MGPKTGTASVDRGRADDALRLFSRLRAARPDRHGPVWVVDGNNVMGQRPGWWRDKPRAQTALLERIADLAAAERLPVILVFDGRPCADLPDRTLYRGILVLYARKGSSADDLIADLARRIAGRESAIVVTSDRELRRTVEEAGTAVIPSGAFRRRIESLRG